MTYREQDLVRQLARALLGEMKSEGKAPFHIYRRKTTKRRNGKPLFKYYVNFLDPETGEYRSAVSSGQTAHGAAKVWATEQLAKGSMVRVTVGDFARGFFDPDSAFMRYRSQRGRNMSWNHQRHNATYLRRYILPFFKDRQLSSLTHLDVERFQSWLLEQSRRGESKETLSPATVNHGVQSLRHVVKWAIHQRLIREDPFLGVESLRATPRAREPFTPAEIGRLFSLGVDAWPDPLALLMRMVAARCGLRKGELQALRRKSITPVSLPNGSIGAMLTVDASWERSGRLKTTKSGVVRGVPLPPFLYPKLRAALDASPWTGLDAFVFHSGDDPARPMSHKKIDQDFLRAVRALGIDEAERKRRFLTFHAYRHFANTYCLDIGLPVHLIRQIIGHRSERMTEHYTHPTGELTDVMQALNRPFGSERAAPPALAAPAEPGNQSAESPSVGKQAFAALAGAFAYGWTQAGGAIEAARQRAAQRKVEGDNVLTGLRPLPAWARVLEEYSVAADKPLLLTAPGRVEGQAWTLVWYGAIGQIHDLWKGHLKDTDFPNLSDLVSRLYRERNGNSGSLEYQPISYKSVRHNKEIALPPAVKAMLRRNGFPPS